MQSSEILGSNDLQELYGTPASTWRYWSQIGKGPASFKIGRRRVWRRSTVEEWLAEQERASERPHEQPSTGRPTAAVTPPSRRRGGNAPAGATGA